MEVMGKGRGVIALEDIPKGKVIFRDIPLAGAIYGDETQGKGKNFKYKNRIKVIYYLIYIYYKKFIMVVTTCYEINLFQITFALIFYYNVSFQTKLRLCETF